MTLSWFLRSNHFKKEFFHVGFVSFYLFHLPYDCASQTWNGERELERKSILEQAILLFELLSRGDEDTALVQQD
jgi:hypothetical protein